MCTVKQRLQTYRDYMRIQNYSKSTIKSYLLWLKQFLEFREDQLIQEPIDQEQARLFILFKLDQGCAWPTINCLYSALRKYFREVLDADWCIKKIPRPQQDKVLPTLASKQDIRKLIEHAPLYKHQIIITLMYATGLRLNEALHLRLSDVDSQQEYLFVKHGKGAKDRYVYLPNQLLVLLRVYYKRVKPEQYLFNGRVKGKPLSAGAMQKAILRARQSAGLLKQITSHTLRHCYATHHLEAGTNLVFLQRQMGHKHLKTTAKYIRLCKNYHRTVHHPINSMQVSYYLKNRR